LLSTFSGIKRTPKILQDQHKRQRSTTIRHLWQAVAVKKTILLLNRGTQIPVMMPVFIHSYAWYCQTAIPDPFSCFLRNFCTTISHFWFIISIGFLPQPTANIYCATKISTYSACFMIRTLTLPETNYYHYPNLHNLRPKNNRYVKFRNFSHNCKIWE